MKHKSTYALLKQGAEQIETLTNVVGVILRMRGSDKKDDDIATVQEFVAGAKTTAREMNEAAKRIATKA